ncbi:hypothetical protein [Malacoplasma muris]|uniref:hypothetical protein n=1 Tax=Malacoplasma muris TaxID=2119 RepID=UPI00398F4CD9
MQFDFFTPFTELSSSKKRKDFSINNESKDVKLFVAYLKGKKSLSDFDSFISKIKKKDFRYNHALNYLSVAIDKIEELIKNSDKKNNYDIFACQYDNVGNFQKGWLTQKGNDLIEYFKLNFFYYKLPIIEKDYDYLLTNNKDFNTNSRKKLDKQISKKYVAFLEYYWGQAELSSIDAIVEDIKEYIADYDKSNLHQLKQIFDGLICEFYDDYSNKLDSKNKIDKFDDNEFILTNVYVKNMLRMTDAEKHFSNLLLTYFKLFKEKGGFDYRRALLFLRWTENIFVEKLTTIKNINLTYGEIYFLIDNVFNQSLHILAYVYFYGYKKSKLN